MRTQANRAEERDEMTAALRNGTLYLRGDLDYSERRQFMAVAQLSIEGGDPTVRLNCSTVDVITRVDDAVIGMLVALVRAARNRGARLVLVRAPKLMRAQFDAAGVAHLFGWRG